LYLMECFRIEGVYNIPSDNTYIYIYIWDPIAASRESIFRNLTWALSRIWIVFASLKSQDVSCAPEVIKQTLPRDVIRTELTRVACFASSVRTVLNILCIVKQLIHCFLLIQRRATLLRFTPYNICTVYVWYICNP